MKKIILIVMMFTCLLLADTNAKINDRADFTEFLEVITKIDAPSNKAEKK